MAGGLTQRLRQVVPLLLSTTIVAIAAVVLFRTLTTIRLADILEHLRAIPAHSIALAFLLCLTLFLVLALYETHVVRSVGPWVSRRRALLASLIAFPTGHAIGASLLSGGAIRYRFYAPRGMPPYEIAKVVLLAMMPYAAGIGVWLAMSLLLRAPQAATVLHSRPEIAQLGGLLLIGVHLAYIVTNAWRRQPLRFGRFLLALPGLRMTLLQYVVGMIDVACAAGILFLFLPETAGVGYLTFVGLYALAAIAGALSNVPAGLGVIESVLILLLPQVPQSALLGAVLAYRFVFELVPLIAALALFALFEVWLRWPGRVRR
jgi:uncharacterized membrane protein YbhN (UPF0104 family)